MSAKIFAVLAMVMAVVGLSTADTHAGCGVGVSSYSVAVAPVYSNVQIIPAFAFQPAFQVTANAFVDAQPVRVAVSNYSAPVVAFNSYSSPVTFTRVGLVPVVRERVRFRAVAPFVRADVLAVAPVTAVREVRVNRSPFNLFGLFGGRVERVTVSNGISAVQRTVRTGPFGFVRSVRSVRVN